MYSNWVIYPYHHDFSFFISFFLGSPLINLNFCSYCGMLCSLDGTVRLLELETGRPLIPAISLTSVATQCAFVSILTTTFAEVEC